MQTCRINGITIGEGRPALMGVLNLSPESFFAGSYVPTDHLMEAAGVMIDDGAVILDIGARSTAPDSPEISVQEEKERVIQALRILSDLDLTISLDTMYPEVFREALRYEIHAINDISGFMRPEMAATALDGGVTPILMATRVSPGDCQTFDDTKEALRAIMNRCRAAGIDDYILDPGIGRWFPNRTAEADIELCRRFDELKSYSRPLLAAVSRKSFIGSITGRAASDRLAGSLAVTSYLIPRGASLIRTHDVAATRDLIAVSAALGEIP